jgi:alpha-D-xyloside xylohydrolase
MDFKQIFNVILLTCLFSNILHSESFQKQSDGVLFELIKHKPTDPQWLKIQVCTENIFRVLAAPEKSFSDRPSLMVEKTTWDQISFTVKRLGNRIEIATSQAKVCVDSKTGMIAFYDKNNRMLLREKSSAGKVITAAEVGGERTYHIQSVFESPHNEAFYGLGGHQNAVMNYKDYDVDLWQHNMVEVVPFLVSNKNYGILWDNNSHTKYGDTREFESLSALTLHSRDGSEIGLTAEYFKDTAFTTLFTSRTEHRIEHEFIDINDEFPSGFQQNVSAVRWSGTFESKESGIHKFRLYCSGYTKLWLDGKLVVDSWRQNWNPWIHLPRLEMKAGRKYQIKIEWIHSGGYIGLKYLTPEKDAMRNTMSLYSEVADQIDYYFIHGNNLDQVIHGYRVITGKAPMMPKWAMGFWQSREHYNSQDDILSTLKEFRKRQIPLDNIVQDWFYWKEDSWGSHEFDSTRYHDPKGMIQTLHNDLHTQIMISVWPKFYAGLKNYDLFNEKGWLYKRNVEKGQKDWVGPGYVSTFYDSYNADARKLFWKLMDEKLFSLGIDGWWLDCSEPDICSNLSRTETILRQNPTALGSGYRYLNAFSLMHAKGVYEGQRNASDNQRVYILTRSAFAGQQRYSATTWSGDIASRWYDLKAQISSGMNFSLSGIPYWSMDIGGFAVESRYEHPSAADLDEWRELNTRWIQFGMFVPIFRVHGQFPLREVYNIAPDNHPAYQSIVAYDKLRYRLMPYIYSLAGMVTHKDYTIMRGLVMDFENDKNVLDINDQFMFGPAFLINPVSEYKSRSRAVYLPSGRGWYDLRNGKYFKGGQTIEADAPYTDIPIYVKTGSIIPCGPEIQYTTETQADPIRLFVYTGNDGSFMLYEDENVNYNYEKGNSSTIPLSYNEKGHTLTVGKRQGKFPGMLETRTFEINWISSNKPAGLDFQSKPDTIILFNGNEQSVRMK